MSLSSLQLVKDRTLVMGILNVTPDSFADGGRYDNAASAIERGLEMMSEGADIIDVGGESTRPGAERVSAQEEELRVLPVIQALAQAGAIISIDTMRAKTAKAAILAGAKIVNDVSAGLSDEHMLTTVASLDCPYIAMHTRGNSQEMNSLAIYKNVVTEVVAELSLRIEAAIAAGISKDNLIVDPGLGFAKEAEHNWELLNNLEAIESLGFPVLVGASRKRFLGSLISADTPDNREEATIALTALIAKGGTWAVRVHSVKPHRDAIAVAKALL